MSSQYCLRLSALPSNSGAPRAVLPGSVLDILFRTGGCVSVTGSVVESVKVDSVDRVFDWSELLGTESREDSGVREVGGISGDELREVRGDSSTRGGSTKGEVARATVVHSAP
jgi:hypothetical protein